MILSIKISIFIVHIVLQLVKARTLAYMLPTLLLKWCVMKDKITKEQLSNIEAKVLEANQRLSFPLLNHLPLQPFFIHTFNPSFGRAEYGQLKEESLL
jgi:hypothetical protein